MKTRTNRKAVLEEGLSIFLMKPELLQVAVHFENNCIKIKGDMKTMTI